MFPSQNQNIFGHVEHNASSTTAPITSGAASHYP